MFWEHSETLIVPDICQFWDTTTWFSPVKVHQKVRKFATKSSQNRPKYHLLCAKRAPGWKKYTTAGCGGCDIYQLWRWPIKRAPHRSPLLTCHSEEVQPKQMPGKHRKRFVFYFFHTPQALFWMSDRSMLTKYIFLRWKQIYEQKIIYLFQVFKRFPG